MNKCIMCWMIGEYEACWKCMLQYTDKALKKR